MLNNVTTDLRSIILLRVNPTPCVDCMTRPGYCACGTSRTQREGWVFGSSAMRSVFGGSAITTETNGVSELGLHWSSAS